MDFYGINLTGHMGIDVDNLYDIGEVAKRVKVVYGVTFDGETTAAQWGDLAEKYTCTENCRVGTVVCVSNEEGVDLEPCQEDLSPNYVGVISAKPGFLMNKKLKDGAIVGLVGRLPVQVVGPVKKGDFIVPTAIGCARAGVAGEEVFKIGVANASKENSKVDVVECIIK
jgi:hypothetical protein